MAANNIGCAVNLTCRNAREVVANDSVCLSRLLWRLNTILSNIPVPETASHLHKFNWNTKASSTKLLAHLVVSNSDNHS